MKRALKQMMAGIHLFSMAVLPGCGSGAEHNDVALKALGLSDRLLVSSGAEKRNITKILHFGDAILLREAHPRYDSVSMAYIGTQGTNWFLLKRKAAGLVLEKIIGSDRRPRQWGFLVEGTEKVLFVRSARIRREIFEGQESEAEYPNDFEIKVLSNDGRWLDKEASPITIHLERNRYGDDIVVAKPPQQLVPVRMEVPNYRIVGSKPMENHLEARSKTPVF